MKAYVPRILRDDGMIEDVFGNFPDLMKYIKMDDYTRVTQLVEEQRQEIARLREALELYKRASYQSHSGHWDKTGGGGAGCPACLEARDLRNQAEQALRGGGEPQ